MVRRNETSKVNGGTTLRHLQRINGSQVFFQTTHLRRRRNFPYGVFDPQNKREKMKRILLVEDDKDIVELVRYNLEKEDFQVMSTADGAAGLTQIRKAMPDLLILDLMLPKLSGLDICKEIRRDASLNRL